MALFETKNKRKEEPVSSDEESESDYDEMIAPIEDEKERALESRVFGTESSSLLFGKKSKTNTSKKSKDSKKQKKQELAEHFEKRKAVWKDDDDETLLDMRKLSQLNDSINSNANEIRTNELEQSLKEKYES